MSNETHWRKAFKSNFLASADIGLDTELKLIISHVEQKQVVLAQGRKELKNVAHFTDKQYKPMILNATNCKVLKKFTGKGTIESWKNVEVLIYVDPKVMLKGEEVEGLRFRPYQPVPEKLFECAKCGKKDVKEKVAVYSKKIFGFITCGECGSKLKAQEAVKTVQNEENIPS